MARGYEVAVGADGRAFNQALKKDIIKPVEDAARALDELGDAGDDAGREASRSLGKLEDALKDAQRETVKTERKLEDVGDTGKKGFSRATEATSEFKDEALSNFSEVTSSFDGSMSSVQDLAQGTLGGIASTGLPGVGIAAGIAAIAVGGIGAAMETVDEKTAALKERANDMASAFIEAGTNVLDATAIAAAASDVITDSDKRKEVQAYADALGLDFATAARAYVGDANAMAVVDRVGAEARKESREVADEQRSSLEALTVEQQRTLEKNAAALQAQRELTGVVDDANSKFQDQQAVLKGLINDADSATREVDELGNAVFTLPDGTQIMIDAETGQATTDVAKFKGDVDGIPETLTTRVKVVPDTSAWDQWKPNPKTGVIMAQVSRNVNQVV